MTYDVALYLQLVGGMVRVLEHVGEYRRGAYPAEAHLCEGAPMAVCKCDSRDLVMGVITLTFRVKARFRRSRRCSVAVPTNSGCMRGTDGQVRANLTPWGECNGIQNF